MTMKALELIVGPGDAYRGPSQGHSPEHGDNWMDAVEKINGAISAINDLRGVSNAPSNATSIASSNATPSGDQIVLNEFHQRLEHLELAVAKIMDWMGIDTDTPAEVPVTLEAQEASDEPLLGQAHPAPEVAPAAAIGSAGDISFGQSTDAAPPTTPYPGPYGADENGVPHTEPQVSPPPAPLSTFDGQPGNPVGSTIDEDNDDNLFVISGADGRVEAAEPVEKQGQKPGAEPESAMSYTAPESETGAGSQAAPVLNTTDSAKSPVELQPEAGAGSVNPGIAALADAEREIEAKLEPVDPSTIPPNQDPFDAVADPEHPPSQETIERADATAANNDRKGG